MQLIHNSKLVFVYPDANSENQYVNYVWDDQ